MRRPWPLVGRTSEVERIGALLTGEERSAVVVAGLAGAGKTRLGSEGLALAGGQGLATARGKGAQAARELPFGALAALLPGTIGSRIDPADMLWRARQAVV